MRVLQFQKIYLPLHSQNKNVEVLYVELLKNPPVLDRSKGSWL